MTIVNLLMGLGLAVIFIGAAWLGYQLGRRAKR